MLKQFLQDRRTAVLKRWFDLVIATYPPDARRFFSREKNQFANPVGATIARELEAIYDQLAGEMDRDRLSASLENIIRIRAVQDFPPSLAAGFMFDLKKAVREQLAAGKDPAGLGELFDFEARIDRTALMAFDVFMQCREKVQEIRNRELKNRLQVLERVSIGNQGPPPGGDEPAED